MANRALHWTHQQRFYFSNHRFEFQKRSQLIIRAYDETFSVVAMRVCNPNRSPVGINCWIQPQLQPAFLTLSAMISQYFIRVQVDMNRRL